MGEDFSSSNFNANMTLLLSFRSSVAYVVFSIRLVRGWWLLVMHLRSNTYFDLRGSQPRHTSRRYRALVLYSSADCVRNVEPYLEMQPVTITPAVTAARMRCLYRWTTRKPSAQRLQRIQCLAVDYPRYARAQVSSTRLRNSHGSAVKK